MTPQWPQWRGLRNWDRQYQQKNQHQIFGINTSKWPTNCTYISVRPRQCLNILMSVCAAIVYSDGWMDGWMDMVQFQISFDASWEVEMIEGGLIYFYGKVHFRKNQIINKKTYMKAKTKRRQLKSIDICRGWMNMEIQWNKQLTRLKTALKMSNRSNLSHLHCEKVNVASKELQHFE